jgi:hypothetical protein
MYDGLMASCGGDDGGKVGDGVMVAEGHGRERKKRKDQLQEN